MVIVRDETGESQLAFAFLDGDLAVDGDSVSFEYYAVPVDAELDASVDPFFVANGSVGPVVYAGPVRMEIVAIRDALFDRNDSVDIRFTIVPGLQPRPFIGQLSSVAQAPVRWCEV